MKTNNSKEKVRQLKNKLYLTAKKANVNSRVLLVANEDNLIKTINPS